MDAEFILTTLKQRHEGDIWATELSFGQAARRCDFWALSAHRSKGYLAISYEIKTSRADFRRDDYEKQRFSRLYCDQFFYVTPPSMLLKGECPDWAGLIEIGPDSFRTIIGAPHRDKDAPSWELVVSILRSCGTIERDSDRLKISAREWERRAKRAEKSADSWRDQYFEVVQQYSLQQTNDPVLFEANQPDGEGA